MARRRGYRWTLFVVAAGLFVYVTLVEASAWAVAAFFVSGGLWYWLERRKMRELDAPRPR